VKQKMMMMMMTMEVHFRR